MCELHEDDRVCLDDIKCVGARVGTHNITGEKVVFLQYGDDLGYYHVVRLDPDELGMYLNNVFETVAKMGDDYADAVTQHVNHWARREMAARNV